MIEKLIHALIFYMLISASASAPPDTKSESGTPKQNIRELCDIKPDLIDCSNKDIEQFFSADDWINIKNETFTNVDLSGNNFTTISMFPKLDIKTLNLSRCEIVKIEKASFKNLQNLTELDLSYNKLTSEALNSHVFEGRYSPSEYEPLVNLRALDLSYNQLNSLNQDVFEHIPELTELILNGNTMGMIDHVTMVAIASLPMLEILEMSDCGFFAIPDAFFHTLKNLEYLDLSANELKTVPGALEEARKLKYLNLDSNPIYRIEKFSEDYPPLPHLRALQELHLSNMTKLKHVSDQAFGGNLNLRILYMNYNENLEYLGPKALAAPDGSGGADFYWPELRELHLRNSNIKLLDKHFLKNWKKLDVLDLSFNPLDCSCSSQWLVKTVVPIIEEIHPNSTKEWICATPDEIRSNNFYNRFYQKLSCFNN